MSTERPRSFAAPLILAGWVAALAQVVFEGYRWQLTPAWVLLSILCMGLFALALKRGRRITVKKRRVLRAVLLGFAWSISLALPMVIPVFHFPKPSGPYQVGTRWMHLQARHVESGAYATNRELMVKIWYPTKAVTGQQYESYWPDDNRFGRIMSRTFGMPSYAFSHLDLVKSNSYLGAPVNDQLGPLPVVIFSHGYAPGYVNQNLPLMEELASQGYLVCSIAHTTECLAVLFPDGRFVSLDQELVDRFNSEIQEFKKHHKQIIQTEEIDQYSFKRLVTYIPTVMERASLWASDIRQLIDELELIQQGDRQHELNALIDLQRLGAAGMSFGGACSVEASIEDPRIRAVVNLDGFHYGSALKGQAVPVPYLLFSSDMAVTWRNDFVLTRVTAPATWLIVKESHHFDFSDFVFFGAIYRWLDALGPHGGTRMNEIVNRAVTTFFRQHLSTQDSVPATRQELCSECIQHEYSPGVQP